MYQNLHYFFWSESGTMKTRSSATTEKARIGGRYAIRVNQGHWC